MVLKCVRFGWDVGTGRRGSGFFNDKKEIAPKIWFYPIFQGFNRIKERLRQLDHVLRIKGDG